MGKYVDGFVLVVPKKKVDAYKALAKKAAKVWMEHGALEYRECVAEDMKVKCGTPFPKGARAKPSETVVFSWITYKSRAHRDRVNAAVMKDPRMGEMIDMSDMPFDMERMMYGGFTTLVEATA